MRKSLLAILAAVIITLFLPCLRIFASAETITWKHTETGIDFTFHLDVDGSHKLAGGEHAKVVIEYKVNKSGIIKYFYGVKNGGKVSLNYSELNNDDGPIRVYVTFYDANDVFYYTGNKEVTDIAACVFDLNGGQSFSKTMQMRDPQRRWCFLGNEEPVWTGHKFLGWNTRKDGTGIMYETGDVVIFSQPRLVLYAQWSNVPKINPFADVSMSHWAYEAVKHIYDAKIMVGKGIDKNEKVIFAPADYITRAEAVMVLYNLEKKPEVTYQPIFSDVKKGQWYSEAVTWAYQKSITAGYGDKFGVKDKITREQFAVMLYSYAKMKKYPMGVMDNILTHYSDYKQISSWAEKGMKWAVYYSVMNGDGKNLKPRGYASRAEIAAMIDNFMEIKVN